MPCDCPTHCTVKRFEAIGNTSDINRYGMMFTPGALWRGYEQSWEHGLPANLGHDLHALVGWNAPLALYFTAKRTAFVIEIQCPETKEEQANLWKMGQAARQRRLDEEVRPHLAELNQRLGNALARNIKMEHPSCAALAGPGLARRRFPAVFREADADADGLVQLASLRAKGPGVFELDGLLLFAHPYFRRALSRMNTLNSPFLRAFQESAMPGCLRKIRLDPDMVGLPETYQETIELAYWRGPLFQDDLAAIPKAVTQYTASEADRMINGISMTEFRWNELGERSFECEELRDTETLGAGVDRFGCRYVHTMLNAEGRPDHADGAIRMYNEEAMLARLGKDIARAGKKTKYTKLWRVDGELPIPLWKELLAHYYRDNPQVGEYLGGDRDPVPMKEEKPEKETVVRSELPRILDEADGTHVTTFLKRAQGAPSTEPQVSLLAWDHVQCGSELHSFYEADAIEIVKELRAAELTVVLPADAARVDWRDGVFNFPSVLHDGPNSGASAARTLAACRDMFARWRDDGFDIAVTVTSGIRLGDLEIWTSCAGRLGPVIAWLDHPAAKLPDDPAGMLEWCNRAQGALRELFPAVTTAPGIDEVSEIIRRSGALRFRRMFIRPGEWEQKGSGTDLGIIARPQLSEAKDIIDGDYRPMIAMDIMHSVCRHCGQEYADCPCMAVDGGEKITDGRIFSLVWGRPAKSRS